MTDYLEQAKCQLAQSCTEEAAVNALIALAERKPRFVRVGRHWINIGDISSVNTDGYGSVHIQFSGGGSLALGTKSSTAFLKWWGANADVVRLEPAQDDRSGPESPSMHLDKDAEPIYTLNADHLRDFAHQAVEQFLENRVSHELEDDDNWNDVEMGLFLELDGACESSPPGRSGPEWGSVDTGE